MIAKHTLGTGFRGLLAYLLREGMPGREGEATLLGGNLSGRTARELACEFGVFRRLNRAVSRPVFHAALRLPVGEVLSDAAWRAAAALYLAQLGYTDTAYLVVGHREHHIHVVASRVRFDGSSVETWRDRWRGLAAVEAIEQRFGLAHPVRPTATRDSRRVPLAPEAEQRLGRGIAMQTMPPKAVMAERLDRALAESDGSRASLERCLVALGVQVMWTRDGTGRVHGARFVLLDEEGPQPGLKGSQIGPAYSWRHLEQRLGERAREQLADARRAAPAGIPQRADGGRRVGPERAGDVGSVPTRWETAAPPHPVGRSARHGAPDLPSSAPRSPAAAGDTAAALPVRLVVEWRSILAQQRRWNAHLGEEVVQRRAAAALARAHPELGVPVVLAAIAAATPGAARGLWDLADELADRAGSRTAPAGQGAAAADPVPADGEEYAYGAR
jgi:hypothetical protein